MSSLFSELKRRNVFRVAAAYLVIGWLLAQVLGLAADSFVAPPWVMKMFITLLAIGFIPTILFSWAYELTPEGVKKDSEVDPNQTNGSETANKLNVVTLIAVIAAAGMFVFQQLNPAPQSIGIEAPDTDGVVIADTTINESDETNQTIVDASIAVLPFADLSPEGDQAYFSDGIAEEILNVLVRIDSLNVASRTSAFGFKGQEALGIPLIAEKLKVRHVLEGSVRKAGDTVRITAQLIDAQTDTHLWSETYDRPLTVENIFAVQDEIAGVIVAQLGLILTSGDEPQSLVKVTTENLNAYELYLEAKGLFHVRSSDNLQQVATLYERAVELDPDFAEAWAGLAATYLVMPGWGQGSTEIFLTKAKAAADRATAIDDDLALPYAIRGGVDSEQGAWIDSIQQFDEALKRNPTDLQSIYFRTNNILDLGYLAEAEAGFRHCLKLDPDYQSCKRFLAFTLLYQQDTVQATDLFIEGLLNGQTSYLQVFVNYYGFMNDTESLVLLLTQIFPENLKLRQLRYQYQIDQNLGIDEYSAALDDISPDAETNVPNFGMTGMVEIFPADFLWSPFQPLLSKPKDTNKYQKFRKDYLLENGYVDYWRMHGFPPQCRALGDDDFECDVLEVQQ